MPQTKKAYVGANRGDASVVIHCQGARYSSSKWTRNDGLGWVAIGFMGRGRGRPLELWFILGVPKCSPKFKLVGRKSLFHVTLLRVTLWFPQQRAKLEPRKQTSTATDQTSASSLTNSRHPAHDTRRHDDTPKTRQERCLSPRISSISRSSKIRRKISNHYQEGDQHAPWPACFPPLLCTSS